MFKKYLTTFVLALILITGFSASASAGSYVVTPTYSSYYEVYEVPWTKRGEILHRVEVQKYGYNNDRITAKYWVGHGSTYKESVGVVTAFDSLRMSIYGYWTTSNDMDDMRIQTVGSNYTKEIRGFKLINNSANGGYATMGFTYNIKTALTFARVDMASGPWHSIASYMLGDYTPVFGLDHTKVRGMQVQPSPYATYSSLTSLNLDTTNSVEEPAVEDGAPKADWTLITVDSLKESKKDNEKAEKIKIELVNGVDKSLIKKVSLKEYLLNQDYYNTLMENAHKNKLDELKRIEDKKSQY